MIVEFTVCSRQSQMNAAFNLLIKVLATKVNPAKRIRDVFQTSNSHVNLLIGDIRRPMKSV
jgi:hypothetical protein